MNGTIFNDEVWCQLSKRLQNKGTLVQTLRATESHYVRCIKPNFKKSTDDYDLAGVSSQLRCQGILEAIRISRAAYPNRVEHAAFLKRYVMCLRDAEIRTEGKIFD